MAEKLVFDKIREEQYQLHGTRKSLYVKIQKLLGGIPLVSFFTSFDWPVMITDDDANMLEAVLRKSDLSNGLCLIINSPGGDGEAAERIINICRSYSSTNTYKVIVPSKAKSAATLVCLGAEEIFMGKTSELGAVDPQTQITGKKRLYSVFNILENYNTLFSNAVATSGRIEPYLQQLTNYDPRDIAAYNAAMDVSENITIKALKSGMLSSLSEVDIKAKIGDLFLKPTTIVKTHGRSIFAIDAQGCNLNITVKNANDPLWIAVYELYSRLENLVGHRQTAKCVESKDYQYTAAFIGAEDNE